MQWYTLWVPGLHKTYACCRFGHVPGCAIDCALLKAVAAVISFFFLSQLLKGGASACWYRLWKEQDGWAWMIAWWQAVNGWRCIAFLDGGCAVLRVWVGGGGAKRINCT